MERGDRGRSGDHCGEDNEGKERSHERGDVGRVTHIHHIIPKHRGGTDAPENLIELTVERHAVWHFAEWKRTGAWQDYCAWQALSGQMTMDEARRLAQQEGARKGNERAAELRRGVPHRPETIEKMREAARRRAPVSEETKAKISRNRKGKGVGREVSLETREKIGAAHRGRVKPPESEETRRRKSEAQKKRWATIGRRKNG